MQSSFSFVLFPTARIGANTASPLTAKRDLEEQYSNPVTSVIGGLFLKDSKSVCDEINWDAPKRRKTSLEKLAKDLEEELSKREWFVTGNVNPSFFDASFSFQDPDVKLKGIENYARGVNKLFDEKTTRGEIVACRVTALNVITATWRLEGRVKLGPGGLAIRAFVVYSDLTVDPTSGLVCFQLDRFSIKGSDILLGALPFTLPFIKLPPPAPSIAELRKTFLEDEKKAAKKKT